MKILLPLDMAQPVKPIVDELTKLIEFSTGDAEVRLLFVKEELPSFESVVKTTGDFPDDWEHKVEEKARAGLKEAEDMLKAHCGKITTEIVRGPAAYMIEQVARDTHADITVVTPKAHNLAERLFLGRVSSKVIKHAPGTIVILRTKAHSGAKPTSVLVGIDGSKNSKTALVKSIDCFKLKQAETKITLVHVVDVADPIKFLTPVEFVASIETNLSMEGETFLADGARILSEAGKTGVEIVIHKGDPASELIKMANETKPDLMVLGARGHTAVEHFLLGSVSHRIATHAPCSVAVVKPA
jgi:nucleotide-binding universal stress UspA family protein